MRERPIPFNPSMIEGLIYRGKRMTRREVKRLLRFGKITQFGRSGTPGYDWHFRDKGMRWHDLTNDELLLYCPYGQRGARLWVREAYAYAQIAQIPATLDDPMPVYKTGDNRTDYGGPWKSSRFMPRKASRLLLEITAVRVERLQDISDEDVIAEAAPPVYWPGTTKPCPLKFWFAHLWKTINGPDAWDDDPWVWVIEFKRLEAGQ